MKKLMLFFLSLTCLAAQAQYKSNRKPNPEVKSPLLSYYSPAKFETTPREESPVKLQSFLNSVTTTSSQLSYVNNTDPANQPVQGYGYWGGTKVSSSAANGRLVSIQSYDMQGNFRESKATYQFKRRKK